MSWVAAETLAEGPTPEARIGHTAVYDPESRRIFVFGGSKNKKWFNDVHILDTQTWKWTMVEVRARVVFGPFWLPHPFPLTHPPLSLLQAQGKIPPLAYHSCSMFRGELFVLGGVFPRPNPEPDGCSDSLYIFDPHLSIWYQPIVTGNAPSPRSGYDGSIQTNCLKGFPLCSWANCFFSQCFSPSHSTCVMQERKIYVFGGWDTPVCYNDMYMLDLGEPRSS